MDPRTVFEQIPEQFDKWRPRYCGELFSDLAAFAQLGPGKAALEVGPGTGQATEPVLKTGCSYLAIELSEVFTDFMKNKFCAYSNFDMINADFETYDFGRDRFDLVYSAAAFQWIPEKIGYPKAYEILKSGGTFAMFMMRPDLRPGGGYTDEPLYSRLKAVYDQFFRPETPYKCSLDYDACGRYGFANLERREYLKTREYNADDYASLIGTHSDHITLPEPERSLFYEGIKDAIYSNGNKITLYDKITMYTAKKP